MINNHFTVRTLAIIVFICTMLSTLVAQDYKVGDKSDGSRINPVHLLKLYDEDGNTIDPNDQLSVPFSTKQTCGNECHSYDAISDGFHFNFHDSNLIAESPSEPWIYTDPTTLSIIPLSFRKNKGTFSPSDLNMTPKQFLFRFGPYYPGGDISEVDSLQHPDNYFRWMVSGKLEINCLVCHSTDPNYDLAEYAGNIRKQNFRWAAAASSSFTEFKGNASKMPDNYDLYNLTTVQSIDQRSSSPPSLKYDKAKFNSNNKVYFNISKNIPNDNCYYCHSSKVTDGNFNSNWKNEEDVHLKAGLNCVDCHRNGLDHNMVKGASDKMHAASFSCEGCHTNDPDQMIPQNGKLGAPIPKHAGIPTIHFERLSCTTCHSGNWPSDKSNFIKTSRNHFLGMHGTNKAPNVFPHIITDVYTESNETNKIEPRNLIWPSYWGYKNDGNITPLSIKFVEESIRPMLSLDSLFNYGDWPTISDSLLISVLDSITSLNITEGTPVFVTGGKITELSGNKLLINDDISDNGFSWKNSHTVRPASQALGINGCQDCHSIGSSFFTNDLVVESSLISQSNRTISVSNFQNNSEIYQTVFSSTFLFRPWLKIIIILSAMIILIVLVGYSYYGLKTLSKMVVNNNLNPTGEE